MNRATRDFVRRRSGHRCEYCLRHERHSPLASHQIEHIVPKKHGGSDTEDNLAFACTSCNLHKGPNLAGLDPQTGSLTELFNPRRDRWDEHFRRDDVWIKGLTAVGRTTVNVLNMNGDDQIRFRTLIEGDT